MARQDKRKVQKEIRSVIGKAKQSMYDWVITLGREPTQSEVKAWQAGFLAGLNQYKD